MSSLELEKELAAHMAFKLQLRVQASEEATHIARAHALPRAPEASGPADDGLVEIPRAGLVWEYPTGGHDAVRVSIRCVSEPGERADRALIAVQALASDGSQLELPGDELVKSPKVGCYAYLPTDRRDGVATFSVALPPRAQGLRLTARPWGARHTVRIASEPSVSFFSRKTSAVASQPERDESLWTPSPEQFREELERFFDEVRGAETFVFMFSGTTYVNDVRANRPIRLTRCLLDEGVPVLFGFHRWRPEEAFPRRQGSLLQVPIDFTLRFAGAIARRTDLARRRIVVVSYPFPDFAKALNRFNAHGWETVYDCRDDWEAFSWAGAAKWYSRAVERYVVHNCDAVTCVSEPLRDKMQSYGPSKPVHLLPNGSDPGFVTSGYRHVPRKDPVTVGYFGHLTGAWFDWPALSAIARARSDYRFEIIGHSEPEGLELPPNVVLLGPKTHAEINDIASRWSAGIICFKQGQLADGVDPIKVYEYLALGLPTVSFRMPQIDGYPYVWTVEDPASFVAVLDRVIRTELDRGLVDRWLQVNTWPRRTRALLALASQRATGPMKELWQSPAEAP